MELHHIEGADGAQRVAVEPALEKRESHNQQRMHVVKERRRDELLRKHVCVCALPRVELVVERLERSPAHEQLEDQRKDLGRHPQHPRVSTAPRGLNAS
jgi:hypothetical protein